MSSAASIRLPAAAFRLTAANCRVSAPSELARFRAEKVGFIFQQFHLVPYLTAVENVMLAQYFHSLADEQEAAEALRRVGLADRLRHLPSQLSGGEQQRVCVARALINQPNLILADEPTGNLDEVNETLVLGLLTELHREGHTIVMVTHDAEIGRRAERHIELHHGRLAAASLLPQSRHELIDNLLKAIWHAQEDTGKRVVSAEEVPEFMPNRATFLRMAQEGLIRRRERRNLFLPNWESRGRDKPSGATGWPNGCFMIPSTSTTTWWTSTLCESNIP